MPAQVRGCMTWGQSAEMVRQAALTAATDMKVFFAHPHSPWERPTTRNMNGLIREYLREVHRNHLPSALFGRDRRRAQRSVASGPGIPHAKRGFHKTTGRLYCLDVLTPPSVGAALVYAKSVPPERHRVKTLLIGAAAAAVAGWGVVAAGPGCDGARARRPGGPASAAMGCVHADAGCGSRCGCRRQACIT